MFKLSRMVVIGGASVSLVLVAGVAIAAGVPQSTPTAPSSMVGISPCRAFDTRVAAGPLAKGSTTAYRITGMAGMAAQGGDASGCGVPITATAISATITVTGTKGVGFATVFPHGNSRPRTSSINWFADDQTFAGYLNVALADGQVDVFVNGGTTQFVLDITGYYVPGGDGPAGPSGPAGPTGPAGVAGPAGPTGEKGDVGPAGPSGADGATGVTGPPGPTGAIGPVGLPDVDGATGPAGPTGPTGPAGPAGDDGAPGPAGPAGPTGASGSDGAGAILAASGGAPVALTTILGGLNGTVAVLPLSGTTSQSATVAGGVLDTTTVGNAVQVFPRNGTLTSISARFSTTTALTLLGTSVTVTAQVFTSSSGSNTLTPLAGATCSMAPSLTGVAAFGTVLSCATTGLNIPVTNRTAGVLVISATAAGLQLVGTFPGYASASLAVS